MNSVELIVALGVRSDYFKQDHVEEILQYEIHEQSYAISSPVK